MEAVMKDAWHVWVCTSSFDSPKAHTDCLFSINKQTVATVTDCVDAGEADFRKAPVSDSNTQQKKTVWSTQAPVTAAASAHLSATEEERQTLVDVNEFIRAGTAHPSAWTRTTRTLMGRSNGSEVLEDGRHQKLFISFA